jgi:hypothetical protein
MAPGAPVSRGPRRAEGVRGGERRGGRLDTVVDRAPPARDPPALRWRPRSYKWPVGEVGGGGGGGKRGQLDTVVDCKPRALGLTALRWRP